MVMSEKRICPKCRNSITVGGKVVLVGKTKTGLEGLVMLNAKLGDYSAEFSDDFTLVEGNVLKLLCPICHQNLSNKKNKNLAQILRIDENGNESTIVFSQIYGEKSTYLIKGNKVTESFGDHGEKYNSNNVMSE